MSHFNNQTLYKTRRHSILLILKILRDFLIVGLPVGIIVGLIYQDNIAFAVLACGVVLALVIGYHMFFWSKSYFVITPRKLSMKVRNGIFSKYHMSIYFKEMKDIAYSQNHFLHYMLSYGTFFARSGGGDEGDFVAKDLKNIEKVYSLVSKLYSMQLSQRADIDSLQDLQNTNSNDQSRSQVVEQVSDKLTSIQGIKQAIQLDKSDIDYIFKNEQDKNHGVYSCLQKDIVLAVTHDSQLRDPDEQIVWKKGDKVIFPAVDFHEIDKPGVLSSSPGLEIHQYLSKKFDSKLDEKDATLIIGFNL